MVCPPTFIATRQRCGGACREELGDPWVAFFLKLTQQQPETLEQGKDLADQDVAHMAVPCRLMHELQNGRAPLALGLL